MTLGGGTAYILQARATVRGTSACKSVVAVTADARQSCDKHAELRCSPKIVSAAGSNKKVALLCRQIYSGGRSTSYTCLEQLIAVATQPETIHHR